MSVILETTLGDITVDLYIKDRPRASLNFLKLCKTKYYNYTIVHSVQRDFMVQMGDPSRTGRGGESIFSKLYGEQAKFFEAEVVPKLKHIKIGTLSMVNNGENMHGSQFFLTTGENLDYLDGVHTVFGEVSEGLDVLLKINEAICDEKHRPYKDIRLNHTVILDDPFDDPRGLEVPPVSPLPTKEQMETDFIGADEEIDDLQGKSLDEVEEEIKEKEARARATILEMVGDIPDAEVKPPENVLFVCKLNPVTTDDDLEIIFSRFGTITSCEIIRDKKSGESLQYAFIEFDKEEDCENAFFKMDNVLIDDRRIHVDFSQSVAKLKWQEEQRRKRLALKTGNPALPPPKNDRKHGNASGKDRDSEDGHSKEIKRVDPAVNFKHSTRSRDRYESSKSREKSGEKYRKRDNESRKHHRSDRKKGRH